MTRVHQGNEGRLLAVLLAVTLMMAVLVVGPARAQEAVTVEDTGWYTATAVSVGGVPLGDPVGNATFEQGDLPVGAGGEEEHKRSYLRLGLPEAATGVEIELPLSEDPEKTFGAAGPILACPVTERFNVSSGGELESAPEVDCSSGVEGEPDAEIGEGETPTTYRFDLAPLLPQWEELEEPGAFALVADVSEPQDPYQYTFVAELGEEIGTAETSDENGSGPVVPPPTIRGSDDESASDPGGTSGSGESDSSPSDSLSLPSPDEDPSSGETEEAEAPSVAPPEDADGAGGQEPVTQEPAREPAMALPSPAPVRALPWVLALLLAGGVLATAGGSLRPAAHEPTSLDRMLGP